MDALATPEDFPSASVVVDTIEKSAYPASRERDAIVATHGLPDEEALRQIRALKSSYVGHDASTRRLQATMADLTMSGFDPNRLALVACRQCLESETRPFQEVTLGIIADLVSRRRGSQARGDPPQMRLQD